MKKLSSLFILSLLSILSVNAQILKSGPQILSFHSDVDDTEQPYACYIPKGFNPKKEYPLVVMLHGAGSNHRLGLRRVFGKSNALGESDIEASLNFPIWKDVNYIVVSTNARGTMGYQGVAEKDVWDMIADIKKRSTIDTNRMYLTGLSMGGGGTLWLGLTRADTWAAIAPVCPAPPSEAISYLDNVLGLPIHFFQGGADPVVKPEGTREWVEKCKKAGAKVTYQEYPGVSHDSWVNAYRDEFVFTWFSKFKRNPFPKRVKLSTDQLKYNSAYWVKLTDKESAKKATIDAFFKDKNRLEITTVNVRAFALDIVGHPDFKKKSQLSINVDGQNLSIFALNNGQSLVKKGEKWVIEKTPVLKSQKNSFTEGPMTEVASDRHIYVYGTADNPSKDELAKRMKIAEQAADWSYYRGDFMGRVMVFPRVLADKEVRMSDTERSNLVLFGDASSNSMIAKFSDKLPIKLKQKNQANASLNYIMPNGKKYILINSGLSFAEIPPKDTSPFASLDIPGKIGSLNDYGDYVLYDKTLNKVLATGYFDNNWELLPQNKEALIKSGMVELK